ncbi:MAG: DUF1697 domain-containing protein [Armatimonadetes bacterium]|nr:DUF1697 domain-containing protein [Armatimonadota bacterium]
METYIALLRGINVGGKNKIKMADLRAALLGEGFQDVTTHLQSGNVILKTGKKPREAMQSILEDVTHSAFGIRPQYFVRTVQEWERLIAENPFEEEAKDDPSHVLAVLMRKPFEATEVEKLQELIQGPEKIRAGCEALYITYPAGIGTSTEGKTPGWNKHVGSGTGRNWNTVLKLLEIARS